VYNNNFNFDFFSGIKMVRLRYQNAEENIWIQGKEVAGGCRQLLEEIYIVTCKSTARQRLVETHLRSYDRDINSNATRTQTFPLQRLGKDCSHGDERHVSMATAKTKKYTLARSVAYPVGVKPA
jgi:hypothetical protein